MRISQQMQSFRPLGYDRSILTTWNKGQINKLTIHFSRTWNKPNSCFEGKLVFMTPLKTFEH